LKKRKRLRKPDSKFLGGAFVFAYENKKWISAIFEDNKDFIGDDHTLDSIKKCTKISKTKAGFQ